MTGTLLLQSALAGITNGFVYALVGLGIAVVFRGTRIINAMQGEFALIGGMVAYLLLDRLGLPLPLALSGRCPGRRSARLAHRAAAGAAYAPSAAVSEESYLLLTLGTAFAISAGVLYFFGRDARILPGIGGEGSQVCLRRGDPRPCDLADGHQRRCHAGCCGCSTTARSSGCP